MDIENIINIPIGKLQLLEKEIVIVNNYEIHEIRQPCKHCFQDDSLHWICPRVVIIGGKGFFCSIAVCIDCINEALENQK